MVKRRAYLAAAGTALFGTTTGCLSSPFNGPTRTEFVQYQHIKVDVATSVQNLDERDLLRLESRQPGEIRGYVAEEYADLVDDDGTISVAEDHHRSFEEDYAGVRYAVSFCGGELDPDGNRGCRGTNISRTDFNSFQFGDEVMVDFDASDGRASVTSVEQGSTEGWDINIETVRAPDRAE